MDLCVCMYSDVQRLCEDKHEESFFKSLGQYLR